MSEMPRVDRTPPLEWAPVSELLKLLSHPTRLAVLRVLGKQEISVGELARALALKDAAVSQQLALLRAHGLVRSRREGHSIYYQVSRDDVRGLVDHLFDAPAFDPPTSDAARGTATSRRS